MRLLFKPPVLPWALYDMANTSFAVVIITVIFPVYFTNIVAAQSVYGKNFGDLMWGISTGGSMLAASFFAPIFGAIADASRSKNKFLTILTSICIMFCIPMFFIGRGMLIEAMILFMIANFFYQTSMMFYDSFLPEISNKNNVGMISGFGFSLGYLGGLLTLILIYPFIKGGLEIGNLYNIRLTFIITALFFLIFSLPSFLLLKDLSSRKIIHVNTSYIRYGFGKLANTLRKIKKDKNLLRFLISYFLFSNAFSVLAVYVAVYARNTLHLALSEIALLFILGHIPAIVSSIFFGWLSDRLGSKKVIILTLIIWCIVIVLITVINLKIMFYIVYILAAVATGSTLIASRSLMSFLTPIEREAEYFGFYAIGGKFSSILGPVVFGILAYFTGSEKIAMLSTLIFLVSGLGVISFVKVPKMRVYGI